MIFKGSSLTTAAVSLKPLIETAFIFKCICIQTNKKAFEEKKYNPNCSVRKR